jgi:hypothetical protein
VAFSFYATKNLTTAEGGMLTGSIELIDEGVVAHLHGMNRDAWKRADKTGIWRYDIVMPGYKYNMTDIQAAMGLAQMQKLGAMLQRRREIVARYDAGFAPLDSFDLLARAVVGERMAPTGEALGVCEVSTSPGLLRAVDAVLKAVPVGLVEIRLADDLGGHALAVFDGTLPDVQEALDMVGTAAGGAAQVVGASLLPRLDDTLREVLAAGTRFGACANWKPAGAEVLKTEG